MQISKIYAIRINKAIKSLIKRIIHIESKHSRETFEYSLNKGINEQFQFFPKEILYGKLEGHTLSGIINPPSFISDPFRNRVKGSVNEVNGKVECEMIVTFGWVNWVIVILWYIPLLSILKHEKNQEIGAIVEVTLGMTLFSMFCALLLYLKLRWDSNRLKKWIELNC